MVTENAFVLKIGKPVFVEMILGIGEFLLVFRLPVKQEKDVPKLRENGHPHSFIQSYVTIK